ncbi:hypothetical protein ACVWY5_003404 [Bradyrhizobium sp. USDA 3256]
MHAGKAGMIPLRAAHPRAFRSGWIGTGAPDFCFDAFSSCEPVSTSLENALAGIFDMLPRFKAAAVHAAPVFLDSWATTEKAIAIIREAARAGAELIAFPETYIPAFPVWAALWPPIDNHDLFVRMAEQSVLADGPEVARLLRRGACPRRHRLDRHQRAFGRQRRGAMELEPADRRDRRNSHPSPQAGSDLL